MATFIKAGFWEKLCKPCKGYKGWLNLDELIQSLAPPAPEAAYKVYTALLTQTETDAPVATVLENTIGNIYWIRQTTGGYQGILLNAFVSGKSWAVATGDAIAGDFVQIGFNDENTVQIWNYDLCSGTCSLNDGTAIYIEIRVYN
jgi:hypothetical protein